jgi:hypothetical protein
VKKPATAKIASLKDLTAAMVAVPTASAVAHKVLDKSPTVDAVPDMYVDMLYVTSVDIDSPPLADYEAMPTTWRRASRVMSLEKMKKPMATRKESCKRYKWEVFKGVVANEKGRAIRTGNYIEFEDVILIKVWEAISMDGVTD